jgi:transcriptional regulator with GAF, ATPase, and Fis domain
MPRISVPLLRQRREEIPWLIADAVAAMGAALSLDLSLVETCILRVWPGNVRELLSEIKSAVWAAQALNKGFVAAEHLSPTAGAALQPLERPSGSVVAPEPVLSRAEDITSGTSDVSPKPSPTNGPPSRTQVLTALVEADGNVSAAARRLRVHRTQLMRLLARYQIDAAKLRRIDRP